MHSTHPPPLMSPTRPPPGGARPTLAFGRVHGVYVYVCLGADPADTEWNRYIDFLARSDDPHESPRVLVVTEGGGPTPAQRRRLNDALSNRIAAARIAVVTMSPIARGIVTALSWFNPVYNAFEPKHLDGALAHVGLFGDAADDAKALVERLKGELTRKMP